MNNTEIIKKNFSRYAVSYDRFADVQNYAGSKLLEQLGTGQFDNILDVGCGTGNYTKLLQQRFPSASITALDICDKMLGIAKGKLDAEKTEFITADAQNVRLNGRFDFISSNACFQWFDDLDHVLSGYRDILNPGGVILFSIFGPKTFCELSKSLETLYNKVVPISSDAFVDEETISKILNENFDKPTIAEDMHKQTYSSLHNLLNTIKYTGTRGGGINGESLGRRRLMELERIYKKRFGDIVATYQIFYCRAKRKD